MSKRPFFADAFNACVFGGKQVVKADELSSDDDFKQVGVDTVRLINECTGNNIEIPEGEETVNMCEGLEGLCKMYASEMLIKNVNTLMKTLDTNLDGACKALQISVQEYEDAKKWLE